MNQGEILRMEAGREMDVLIINKFISPKPPSDKTYRQLLGEQEMFYSCLSVKDQSDCWEIVIDWGDISRSGREDDFPEWQPAISPSTDIAAAWEVVEKINEKYHWKLHSPFITGSEWFIGFTPHGVTGWNGTPDFNASGNTAPLAICRAALLATFEA
jgi:hypothetical protein